MRWIATAKFPVKLQRGAYAARNACWSFNNIIPNMDPGMRWSAIAKFMTRWRFTAGKWTENYDFSLPIFPEVTSTQFPTIAHHPRDQRQWQCATKTLSMDNPISRNGIPRLLACCLHTHAPSKVQACSCLETCLCRGTGGRGPTAWHWGSFHFFHFFSLDQKIWKIAKYFQPWNFFAFKLKPPKVHFSLFFTLSEVSLRVKMGVVLRRPPGRVPIVQDP